MFLFLYFYYYCNVIYPIDVVEESIGTLRKWHIIIIFMIFSCKPMVGWHQMGIVFQAPPVSFECSNNTISKCSSDCPELVYNRSLFKHTIQMQWDLVCGRAQLANVVQMSTMAGIFCGNLLFAPLGDKFGRVYPLFIACVLQTIIGFTTAFIPYFWVFIAFRFSTAVVTGGGMCTSFTYIMEIIGIKWRTTIGTLYQIPFYMGVILLSPIGYFFRDWRNIQIIISAPSIILIWYYWVPESPRWLMSVGRFDDAIAIMQKIAKTNKLPTEDIEDNVKSFMNRSSEVRMLQHHGEIMDLFRTPNIRKNWCIISYNWIVCGLCYFGLSQFMGHTSGDIFINVLSGGVAAIPGTLLASFMMNHFGRCITLITSNMIAGTASLVITFIPQDLHIVYSICGTIGVFGLSMSFCVVYIYSGELFPTQIRNLGVGTSSTCARIGSMTAPYIATFGHINPWVPPIVFGVVPLIGAALTIFLPETKDCILPHTIEEAENFGRTNLRHPSAHFH